MTEVQPLTNEQIADIEKQTEDALKEGTAELKFQERDPFDDFIDQIDQNGERRPPNDYEKERMDYRLTKLGEIFAGSNVNWHLDGAMNISLLRGDYIGVHKDVDISVDAKDVEQLVSHLENVGYGLFLSYASDPTSEKGKKTLERVGAKAFTEEEMAHLMIAAVDKAGKILDNEELNFIDVHLVKRDGEGNPLGYGDCPLPKEWFKPKVVEVNGQFINASYPAKVVFYKLHSTRNYDMTDLEKLAETGVITEDDLLQIEKAFEDEFNARKNRGQEVISELLSKLSSNNTIEEILEVFEADTRFNAAVKAMPDEFKELAKYIQQGHSLDEIFDEICRLFKVEDRNNEQRAKISAFRKMVDKYRRIEIVREEI